MEEGPILIKWVPSSKREETSLILLKDQVQTIALLKRELV
jgi:hypothetical protein